MLIATLVVLTLFVAYANGANDNFKGVATLYGSNTASFDQAMWIGTLATLAGCVASVFLAELLVKSFSGKGLVPDALAASPSFLLAVAAGASSTVMLATVLGFPISTTHALTGALVGAGFVGAGSALNVSLLGTAFFLPLLLSPVMAILLTIPLYKLAHAASQRSGVAKESCICLGPRRFVPVRKLTYNASETSYSMPGPQAGIEITLGNAGDCVQKYRGGFMGVTAQNVVDGVHYASAVAVSFARGLNDTPKIVALLLMVQALDIRLNMLAVALAMALGGLINARKVAETMSRKISRMNDGQALTANFVTAFTVIAASHNGMPVSTTHVAVGAISGIGIVNRTADCSVIGSILMSWVLTLPTAALIAGVVYWLARAAA